MTTLTREEIERGLAENRHAPGGAARNAHAEVLAGAAEASGDAALFREALDNLINAYLYSAESPKLLVPFARLLQEYDKDPGAFSEGATHSLFWQFKWVATAIGNSPDIPLESAMRLAGGHGAPLPDRRLQRTPRTRGRDVARRRDR